MYPLLSLVGTEKPPSFLKTLYASDLTDKEKEETINQAHKIQDEVERGGDGAWDSGPDSPVHKPMKQYESDDDDGEI